MIVGVLVEVVGIVAAAEQDAMTRKALFESLQEAWCLVLEGVMTFPGWSLELGMIMAALILKFHWMRRNAFLRSAGPTQKNDAQSSWEHHPPNPRPAWYPDSSLFPLATGDTLQRYGREPCLGLWHVSCEAIEQLERQKHDAITPAEFMTLSGRLDLVNVFVEARGKPTAFRAQSAEKPQRGATCGVPAKGKVFP